MSKKSKPTKKDQALEEYISYLKDNGLLKKSYTSSFEDKINQMVEESLKPINNKSALEVIKCGVGPSTGYVDGVKYSKDNKQRFYKTDNGYGFSYYDCHNGDLERKQIKAQDKVNWTEDEQIAFTALAENMEDTVGYDLHGEEWGNIDDIADISDEDNVVFGVSVDEEGHGGYPMGAEYWYESDRDDYVEERIRHSNMIEGMFDKSPGLQGDTQLFTLDIPNPELQEGDIFELDTYMCASYKQAHQENKYNKYPDSAIDTNIDTIRHMRTSGDTNGLRETAQRLNSSQTDKLPYNDAYNVVIMGTDGTPVLINQGKITDSRNNPEGAYPVYVGADVPGYFSSYDFDARDYWDEDYSSQHDVFFNKGQKMRVVRIDHEKKTAIYQTVDG